MKDGNGLWLGWGLGDWSHNPDGSDRDNTVRRAKGYMRAMFSNYAGHLSNTNVFDQEMYDVVCIMQDKLVARPMNAFVLVPGRFARGVLDLITQQAMGFKKMPKVLPVIFTVEGHLSDMWHGPAASIASALEGEGKALWRPTGYDCAKLPFNNKDGVEQLRKLVASTVFEDKKTFPGGTPFGLIGFSQGGMIVSEFMQQHVLPTSGSLHWRLPDFKRGLGIGNPRREFGKMCPWNDNPPPGDTGGIMDKLFVTTGTEIADRWQENANDRDMFAVNGRDKSSRDKTAIAKIITENAWGSPAGIFARVLALFGDPVGEGFAAIKASFDAIMFLASNPNPHYSTVAEPGDYNWMRGVAA